ncbi:MAG: hypothetical protein HYR85_06960 [Planctomycetes bacterium]|nr:hypothetical protein [Planctomycetota bacterium]MBI3843911.1 hypothetical protein [Planctomycetota bacterium]
MSGVGSGHDARQLLRRILVVGAVAAGGCSKPDPSLSAIANANSFEVEIAQAPIAVTAPGYHISAESANPERARSVERLLAQELQRYPSTYLKACAMRKIVMCSALELDGKSVSALAEQQTHVIYLDVGLWQSRRDTIHHELFHLFDYELGRHSRLDVDWELLNEDKFRYDNLRFFPRTTPRTEVPKGFISMYATTNPGEDKAELFAGLLGDYAGVLNKARADDVLQRKLETLLKRVRDRVAEMNTEYWEQLPISAPLRR